MEAVGGPDTEVTATGAGQAVATGPRPTARDRRRKSALGKPDVTLAFTEIL